VVRAAVVIGAGVAVAAATALGSAAQSPPVDPVPPIEVVRDGTWQARPACRVRGVAASLRAFTEGLSRGRVRDAVRPFAREPAFQWYSMAANRPGELRVPPERAAAVYARPKLADHFRTRVEQHERLRLIAVLVHDLDRSRRRIGFELVAQREADDLAAAGADSGRAQGKGSVDCRSGRIAVLSLGMAHPGRTHGHCGWRPDEPLPAAILACSDR
jgi:hypothetical protein